CARLDSNYLLYFDLW
nr:immunoglobulin heavy chain junction region [Macaca mulatta]MOW98176.1 immunoglobulin heavy chain junction region [Macaca mulatta]MOW98378.1 immunoglobulin heavy chain junction region [Macaca mulatta]MOW98420.1 immunoglobulin heavy chain junction region [Macaca mulatta]MOW98520.1 immunoglobulin heavy chain junction region [Macaca mulatta]